MPEKPSSGEAGPDDFLSLGAPPLESAASTYSQEHSDSYLPEGGELAALKEGPIADDFLAIGEPPKVDKQTNAGTTTETDSYAADDKPTAAERDSYLPDDKLAAAVTERDSYMPEEKASASEGAAAPAATSTEVDAASIAGLTAPKESSADSVEAKDDVKHAAHEHDAGHDHVHDEVHATTPRTAEAEEEDDEDDDVDGDGVVSTMRTVWAGSAVTASIAVTPCRVPSSLHPSPVSSESLSNVEYPHTPSQHKYHLYTSACA